MTYVASENPMQGIFMMREVLEQDPENRDAIYQMGILSMQTGQFDKAIGRFQDLTRLYPQDVEGLFYLALAQMQTNDKQNAHNNFEKARKLTKDPAVIATIDGYLKELH